MYKRNERLLNFQSISFWMIEIFISISMYVHFTILLPPHIHCHHIRPYRDIQFSSAYKVKWGYIHIMLEWSSCAMCGEESSRTTLYQPEINLKCTYTYYIFKISSLTPYIRSIFDSFIQRVHTNSMEVYLLYWI